MGRDARNTIAGIITGATWHTGVNLAAGSGVYLLSIPEISMQGNVIFDESIGFTDITTGYLERHTVETELTMYARRTGNEWGFVAGIFGDSTLTGVGPTYTHTMNWQQDPALFWTLGLEINDADILEIPSFKPVSWTFAHDGNGFMTHSIGIIGDTVQVAGDAQNAGAQFDTVTYVTTGQALPFREMLFRINAQAGGALASPTDDIALSNFSLTVTRGLESEFLTEGASDDTERQTREPVRSAYDEINLSITTNDYETIALLDDLKDETPYKADVGWSATVGGQTQTVDLEIGSLFPLPQNMSGDSGGGRYELTRNFRCIRPAATPTGMATSNPLHLIIVDQLNATYE